MSRIEIVRAVFEHWKQQTGHSRARLTPDRISVIERALKWGYEEQDLKDAVSGCCKTPHNMGFNERNTRYDSIGLIMRNGDNIERFMGNNDNPPGEVHFKERAAQHTARNWAKKRIK